MRQQSDRCCCCITAPTAHETARLCPSSWIRHAPTDSNLQTVGTSSPEIHVGTHHSRDLHTSPQPEALAQYVAGHNPKRGHHGTAIAMTTNSSAPFITPRPPQSAQNALEGMKIALIAQFVMRHPSGTIRELSTAHMTSKDACSTRADESSAGTSNGLVGARAKDTTTSAQVAETPTMKPKIAPAASILLARCQSKALTPYDADGWRDLLIAFNLLNKYPTLLEQIIHSFRVHAPIITQSFTPPNNPSINVHHNAFDEILHKEFTKQQYIGPFTQDMLEALIGPFQSSPLNIIPKPGKPGKFRLIQNLSYPNSPQPDEALSINSQVDSALFPCEWGTFYTACSLIHTLPQGSQGATRDVAEAYRTIPLHPSQWPALVVHIADEPALFAADTSLCFGYGPSAGTYGTL